MDNNKTLDKIAGKIKIAEEMDSYLEEEVDYLKKIWEKKYSREFQFSNFTIPQQANYLRQ